MTPYAVPLSVCPGFGAPGVAFALRVFSAASASHGDHDRAAMLLGAADALDAELGAGTDPTQNALRENTLRQIDSTMPFAVRIIMRSPAAENALSWK